MNATGARSYRFPRAFRLKRKRLIQKLFDRQRTDVHSLAQGCVRVVYRLAMPDEVGAEVPVQVGFAPGRKAKKAVQRNRIRRLLREVYRVHQHLLVDLFSTRPEVFTAMFIFRGVPDEAAECIPRDLPRLLHVLRRKLESEF